MRVRHHHWWYRRCSAVLRRKCFEHRTRTCPIFRTHCSSESPSIEPSPRRFKGCGLFEKFQPTRCFTVTLRLRFRESKSEQRRCECFFATQIHRDFRGFESTVACARDLRKDCNGSFSLCARLTQEALVQVRPAEQKPRVRSDLLDALNILTREILREANHRIDPTVEVARSLHRLLLQSFKRGNRQREFGKRKARRLRGQSHCGTKILRDFRGATVMRTSDREIKSMRRVAKTLFECDKRRAILPSNREIEQSHIGRCQSFADSLEFVAGGLLREQFQSRGKKFIKRVCFEPVREFVTTRRAHAHHADHARHCEEPTRGMEQLLFHQRNGT